MKTFPENIIFKYPWRNYQQRVLDELDEHLEDDHLHVIAPPGSGKTVLGLEVMIRLDKPTLILAPTIAIRNQWVERFCELFLQVEKRPNWISLDIKNPKLITVSTYQGLHA
ncbi:MAG: DEAD/DEAH box helicase family protein, partial [Bacteroidota bacterium]